MDNYDFDELDSGVENSIQLSTEATQPIHTVWYRLKGMRRISSLMSPPLRDFDSLSRNAVFHYLSQDPDDPNIDTSLPILQDYQKRIETRYPSEFIDPKGPFRKRMYLMREHVRPFHMKHKRFKYFPDNIPSVTDPLQLILVNHSYTDKAYRYAETPIVRYYKWYNTWNTIFATIESMAQKSDRNHFIVLNIPNQIPSRVFLNNFKDKVSPVLLRIFDTDDKLMVLEFWKWLSNKEHDQGMLAQLSKSTLSKLNLVFRTRNNQAAVLNLGYFYSWMKGSDNLTEFKSIDQVELDRIQKLFLKFLMSLQSADTYVDDVTDIDDEDTVVKNESEDDTVEDEQEEKEERLQEKISGLKPKETQEYDPKIHLDEVEEDEQEGDFSSSDLSFLDDELDLMDRISINKAKSKSLTIVQKGNELEIAELQDTTEVTREEILNEINTVETSESALQRILAAKADEGSISASDYRKLIQLSTKYGESHDPYKSNRTVNEAKLITKEDLSLDKQKSEIVIDDEVVFDESVRESSLQSFDSDYINNVMKKDILSVVDSLQKAGVIVKKHDIEVTNTILGSVEHHTLEVKPIDGAASIVHFKIPVVEEDGTFLSGGNKYSQRLQRVDLPIRKIDATTVGLNSYYGKAFVKTASKIANSSVDYLSRTINKRYMAGESNIKKVSPADVFDNTFKAPHIYSALAKRFKAIATEDVTLVFDHTEREKMAKDKLPLLEKEGDILVGAYKNNEPIVVDYDGVFHVYNRGVKTSLGDIYEILKIDAKKAPVDFSEIRIFSKSIPLAVVLGRRIGLKKLLKLLDVKYRTIKKGEKGKQLQHNEYSLDFIDQSLIFSKKDRAAALILGGFLEYDKLISRYSLADMDSSDTYFNMLVSKGLSVVHEREMDSAFDMFIDPITAGILEEMGIVPTYPNLLLKANEMLLDYTHPDGQDLQQMRIRGYERIAGFIYKDLSSAIRTFRNKNIGGKSKINIGHYEIWGNIVRDHTVKIVEDTNPIQNLKEREMVTYVGEGGRGKESMVKKTRAYHKSDMGVVSGDTVDSGDVGVNIYMSTNPQFKNLRGVVKDKIDYNPSNLLSTSALISPGSTIDTARRVNFIQIQQSHTIAAKGYHQPTVRTGYEYVLSNRTGKMFAYNAKKDGEVISVDNRGIIVKYKDGETIGIALGTQYGKAEGSIYPHSVVTRLKAGDTFSKGDNLSYNEGFFEPDYFNPKRVIYKGSMNIKVALYESDQTHEDSSSISLELSQKLSSKKTKVKSYVVDFAQNILNPVQIKQSVGPETILMTIEDSITTGIGSFSDDSLEGLQDLANQSPRSGMNGVIDRIEVYYHGDKADMSAGLRTLADNSDKLFSKEAKSINKAVVSGRVTEEHRVRGTSLGLDRAEIRIYITTEIAAGMGD